MTPPHLDTKNVRSLVSVTERNYEGMSVGALVAFSPINMAIRANKIPIFWYCYECHPHCTFAAN